MSKYAGSKWQKLQRLSWRERRLIARAVLAVSLSSIALRLLGLARCQAMLRRLSPVRKSQGKQCLKTVAGRAQAIAAMVKLGARRAPLRASCLRESLALWWLLRLEGIDSDLRIGVRKESGRLQAHAWVEHLGQVLNDSQDAPLRFAVFDKPIAEDGLSQSRG